MLLHIGYHKTASTWLQQRLFDNREAMFHSPWSFNETINHIVRPHPLEWDEDTATLLFQERRQRTEAEGLVPVLSNEELSGNPHSGGFNNTIIASRLATIFPDARVLIVIRDQPSMLVSMYKQYISRGGILSPHRYFEPPGSFFRVPGFRPGHLEYHHLIELYQKLFGGENVRVLAMEAMVEDRASFLDEILTFAGGRTPNELSHDVVRRSPSAAATAIQRRLNRWLLRDDVNPAAPFQDMKLRNRMASLDRWLAPWLGRACDKRLRTFVESYAQGRYGRTNQRTAELTGLPLEQYGYDLRID